MYAGYFPMGLSLDRIFKELPGVPFKDEVWPKFLRHNAERVFELWLRLAAIERGARAPLPEQGRTPARSSARGELPRDEDLVCGVERHLGLDSDADLPERRPRRCAPNSPNAASLSHASTLGDRVLPTA